MVILHHVLGPLDHEMLVVAEPQAVHNNRVEPVHDAPERIGREGAAPECHAAVDVFLQQAQKHTENDQGGYLLRVEDRTSRTVAVIHQSELPAALDDGRGIVEDGLHRVPEHQEDEQGEEGAGKEGFEEEGHVY